MKRARIVAAVGVLALPVLTAGTAGAQGLQARDDHYRVRAGKTLDVRHHGVLANDRLRGPLGSVVRHTAPSHGSVSIDPSGTFRYTPAPGFTGTDSFTYTVSDAVKLYPADVPPLATIGGVQIKGGAYGSSLAAAPGSPHEVYGLTDRGPNVDAPDGGKIEPLPAFTPAIGKFRLDGGKAVLEKVIPLRAADGTPYSGRVSTQASTGEKIVDLDGKPLATDPNGYDSEGLAVQRDGTFWVSDEYGPFITHFGRDGRAIERLSPFDGSLPKELANRVPNKGMEGLTLTPDGRTLVGIMQSALQQPDLTKKPGSVTTLRIVTVDLATRATREFLYLLDNPKDTKTAVSEITALSATRFLVDERDGATQPGAYKKLFEIDLAGATDVGPRTTAGPYDAAKGGLLVKGKSVDAYVGTGDTATAAADLAAAGIKPVSKKLHLDLGALVSGLDPAGGFFGHDKVEGVFSPDGGRTVVLANDNDFGIDHVTNSAPPYQLGPKLLPGGRQDDGEYLVVDTAKLPAATSTATVTISVR
ncbi:esterase-like activity of phytase family protein [Amycolatopsis sp. NPDC059021]|uniref:esterase-like activity of phytase family protein n=1 Tax=Amycolatopsis sp. NPDC059021 TaxID=3346704 RepID=UPI00366C7857